MLFKDCKLGMEVEIINNQHGVKFPIGTIGVISRIDYKTELFDVIAGEEHWLCQDFQVRVPNKNKTYTMPPKEIYDVLHAFEALGGELPKIVDEWWEAETLLIEKEQIK
jgi:hypothetical protein